MTLQLFYLGCFVVGLTLTVLAFVGGTLHLSHLHLHLPHLHPPVPHGGVGLPHPGAAGGAEIPAINFATLSAFLTWFGGTGYLLTRHSTLVVGIVMVFAIGMGLAGAASIFGFVVKLLLPHDQAMDPADYQRVGVLGRIVSPIRAGGTGEMTFSQDGARQTCGVRSEGGEPLGRGTEVIVTRYERGIAYVRKWEDLARDRKLSD